MLGGMPAGPARAGGTLAASVGGIPRAVADWLARRSLAPTSAAGISLTLAICASVWFTAGTRPANVKGALVLGAGYLAALAARQLAGQAGRRQAQVVAVTGRRPLADSRRPGWLASLSARIGDSAVYVGLAIGAAAQGWAATWPLAITVLSLVSIRETMTACSGPADPDAVSDGPVRRAIVTVLTMPVGGRVLLIAVVAPVWGARASLLALLDWAIIAVGYGIGSGTATRRRRRRGAEAAPSGLAGPDGGPGPGESGPVDCEPAESGTGGFAPDGCEPNGPGGAGPGRGGSGRGRRWGGRVRPGPVSGSDGLSILLKPVQAAGQPSPAQTRALRPGMRSIPVLRMELTAPPPTVAAMPPAEPAAGGAADGLTGLDALGLGGGDSRNGIGGANGLGGGDGRNGLGGADDGWANGGWADDRGGLGEPDGRGEPDGPDDAADWYDVRAEETTGELGEITGEFGAVGAADGEPDDGLAWPDNDEAGLESDERGPDSDALGSGSDGLAPDGDERAPAVVLRCRDDGVISRWFGRLVRGQLMPLPPALLALAAVALLAHLGLRDLPGLLILAPALVMLVAAPGSSHRHDGRFDWLVPAVLQGAQYIYIAALGLASGVPVAVTFGLCAVVALRYADLGSPGSPVLAARCGPWARRGREPGAWLGWEGRMIVCGLGAAMGIAMFAYVALAAYLGALICWKVMTSGLGLREGVSQ
jgi:hypothetical protein